MNVPATDFASLPTCAIPRLTARVLNFLMKKYTGTTAKHTIIDHIFLEAKHLLDSTPLTVKEIAYELGSPPEFN